LKGGLEKKEESITDEPKGGAEREGEGGFKQISGGKRKPRSKVGDLRALKKSGGKNERSQYKKESKKTGGT